MEVAAEGITRLSGINTNAGEFKQLGFNVQVTDGTLDLTFSDAGGVDGWLEANSRPPPCTRLIEQQTRTTPDVQEVTDVRMVGNYALNFTWADGHNAGIYTWELLRQLADSDQVDESAIA